MSVGSKIGGLGVFWVTIVTYVRSQRLQACDHTSNTFLVLGPIDLTNGRAGMTAPSAVHAARDQETD
jgi:hypothetical protein